MYGPDGKPAATLTSRVEAFSWDASLALVDEGYGLASVDLVSWRDGTVLWASPPGFALERAAGEPNGTRMAIWVAPANEFQSQSIKPDLYVIGPTGTVIFRIAAPAIS